MPVPEIGQKAKDFHLPATDGRVISLKDFKNKNIVLYFYPKDDTSGCTTEACGFRNNFSEIQDHDAVVLGVSPDSIDKHQKFISKYRLPFLLLSDADHALADAYGVWVQKSMYGRTYMGVERTTFIIGKDGKIARVFSKVKPATHAAEVEEFVRSL